MTSSDPLQHSLPLSNLSSPTPKMADGNPIRFGILGCADIARKVSRAILLAPNSTLSAIGSCSIERAERYAAENGFPDTVKIYGSYDDVLDDPDIDAVYVPLPTSLHLQWSVAAAEKKKHLLLEKPTAVNVSELDLILEACESHGVQFMDGTMWMDHPRTQKMRAMRDDPALSVELKSVHSIFARYSDEEFLKENIRVKPDLDSLGCLGDVGWYCIRSILWAHSYHLPKTVTAFQGTFHNKTGVILSCGASLVWEDGKIDTFECSFRTSCVMDVTVKGSKGTLHPHDFVIPVEEKSPSFNFIRGYDFTNLQLGWETFPTEHVVREGLPEEELMIEEFVRLIRCIKESGSKPDGKWPTISRKTQLVVDAVMASIDKGCEPIPIVG